MYLDKDLSKLYKDFFIEILKYNISHVSRDRINFFLWELKFLDSLRSLQSFAFAHECGMLDVTQKMQEIWKTLYATLDGSEADLDTYFKEFIVTPLRDEFVDPNTDPSTFHVPTEIWKAKLEFRAKYSFPKIPLPANKNDDITPNPKFVMEFIDAVVRNLGDLVKIDDPSSLLYVSGLKEQIENHVFKELMLLRLFVCFVSDKCTEPQIRYTFLTCVLIEAGHAAMITWLYLPIHGNGNQDLAPSEMSVSFSDLLQMKIKPIWSGIHKIYTDILQVLKSTIQPGLYPNIQNKHAADRGSLKTPADNLVELPTVSNLSQIVALNDQMAILQEMLIFLKDNLIRLSTLDLGYHLEDMDSFIVDAGLLVYSLSDSKWEKENTTLEDLNRTLGLDLPSNIQPIKEMIYLILEKPISQFGLPTIHGLGYVDFLLNNLKEFQGRYANSLASVKDQLQIIQKELESLQPFLKAVVEEQHNKLETLHDCARQLISKAYKVEYVVDACINKVIPQWCLEHLLQNIIGEISHIKAKIQEKNMAKDIMTTGTARTLPQLARAPRMNEEIVGFEDVIENLRNQLLRDTRGLDVISIHGMPGQGKTTLAYKLYTDRLIVSRFDILAQCCMSQIYSYKDLLLALLCDVIGEDSQLIERPADELADMLRKALLPKRYLILVDDAWETSAWNDLKGCFPDANNRSRIILTTRHHEVAKFASVHSDPHHLRMFNDDESWKLLEKEVFGEESCSPHLIDVGKRIAKMCGQLPLTITLVAGILKEKEKKEECWEKMAENLGSHIQGDSKAVIERSYENLPYHLRSCFLYFGAFLEEKVIKISKLTRLWISEGFVVSREGKSLQDIAKGYLENLIGRNLVMVAQRSNSDGEVKACRLHDLLLDYCKEKATEENHLLQITWDQNINPSSRVHSQKQYAHNHLAFSKVDNLVTWSSSCSLVGSLFFKNDATYVALFGLPSRSLAISRTLQNFKFLKVLDLVHVVIDFFPTELLYLRYFSAEVGQKSIPSAIANLWNLENLILKCSGGDLLLPITVWEMIKLRHLHIRSDFLIEYAEGFLDNSAKLYDLETLSTPFFSCLEDAESMFRKTPNLRKLRCRIFGSYGFEYNVLNFPTSLEMLTIDQLRYSTKDITFCICAPNLKKLKLSEFCLDLQHMLKIAQLQNLQVLKLHDVGFSNSKWEVGNDEFPQLKVLKLDRLRFFNEWIVADDAFHNLELLVLRGCHKLDEMPSWFGEVSSLKYIELENCTESFVKSAMDIEKTQVEDYENNNFKLVIKKIYEPKVKELDI